MNKNELPSSVSDFFSEPGMYADASWYSELGHLSADLRYPVVVKYISRWLETTYKIPAPHPAEVSNALCWIGYSQKILSNVAQWIGLQARSPEWRRVVDRRMLEKLQNVDGYQQFIKQQGSLLFSFDLEPLDASAWASVQRLNSGIKDTGISILLSLCSSQQDIFSRLRLKFSRQARLINVFTEPFAAELNKIIMQKCLEEDRLAH
jgi:hypothetical protein